jgi:transcription termination factor NusB
MKTYSKNRLGAVQFLFALEFGDASKLEDLKIFCNKEKLNFNEVEKLVKGVLDEREQLDTIIKNNLKQIESWNRMDAVLKNILRTALFEFNLDTKIKKIIVSEYNQMAGSFWGASEAGLVTAILNKVTLAP